MNGIAYNQTCSLNFNSVAFDVTRSEILAAAHGKRNAWKLNFVQDIEVKLELVEIDTKYYCYLHLLRNQKCLFLTFFCEICFLDSDRQERSKLNQSAALYLPDEFKEIAQWDRWDGCAIRFSLSLESKKVVPQQTAVLETLSSDFVKYLEGQVDTDCVLKAGDTQIPVHRTMLCARSEVFAAMFRHNTSENCSGEVDIKNIDGATLKDVVYYIYSGKIRGLTSDTAVTMYEFADMYDLPELKKVSLDFLLKSLTAGNTCDTELLRFIGTRLEEITESDIWKKFSETKASLVNRILCDILLNKTVKTSPYKSSNYEDRDGYKLVSSTTSVEEKIDDGEVINHKMKNSFKEKTYDSEENSDSDDDFPRKRKKF